MADSFSKKENSKKKAKKQQSKSLRRENRKTNNNKGKSLDDMIVYTDINGNLTTTPPHLQNREEDAAKAERETENTPDSSETMFTGTVTYFSEKGYGFITEDTSNENVFFHHKELNQKVNKYDKVSYKKESSPKGNKATNITRIS